MSYLLEHPNLNAPDRGDGRYWGYPTRRGHVVDTGVVHTAENVPDLVPPDNGAEAVARYFTTSERPASYNRISDTDTRIELLDSDHVAFGVKGYRTDGRSWNNTCVQTSMATRAHSWGQVPDWWTPAILDNCARDIAELSTAEDLPLVLTNKDEANAGQRGWSTHAYLDPARRSDPGLSDLELLDLLSLAGRHQAGRVGEEPGDVIARVPVSGRRHPDGRWPTLIATADGRVAAANGAEWVGDMWQTTPNHERRPAQLNEPIVALIPWGPGYYLIAADGGVFSFAAPFPGSLGDIQLNEPIVDGGIVHDLDQDMRRLVLTAADGGTFALGTVA